MKIFLGNHKTKRDLCCALNNVIAFADPVLRWRVSNRISYTDSYIKEDNYNTYVA